MAYEGLTKRALAIRTLELLTTILERQNSMAADISSLRAQIAALTAVVGAFGPALAANNTLALAAITKLEEISAAIATLLAGTPTQADIDGLNASISGALSELQTDAAEVATTNAAIQAELDKLSLPVVVPPPVSEG